MNQEERMEFLIQFLRNDSIHYKNLHVEKNDKRAIIRSLMNIRIPRPVSLEFLGVQDDFLKNETFEKGIVSWNEIPTIREAYGVNSEFSDKISIWQGDITRLLLDAIVNAANSQMLGCFVPCHQCIDNAIHSAAGIELREECNHYMSQKREFDSSYEEPTGSAVVTQAYNLPCNYVVHTVGPIIQDYLTDSLRNDLRSCYRSCLDAAMKHEIRTIAFCCISTGEFRFPNDEAAIIAYDTIRNTLRYHGEKFDRIIINVFKDLDLRIYENIVYYNR